MKLKLSLLCTIFIIGVLYFKTSSANKGPAEVKLSYLMNSSLPWKEVSNEFTENEITNYILSEDDSISILTSYLNNRSLYAEFLEKDKDQIFKELFAGKKLVHEFMNYKNWTLTKNEKTLQADSLLLVYEGNYSANGIVKYFKEKLFVTPHGVIFATLDWTEKDKNNLIKTAQSDFNKIEFKVGTE